MLAKLHPMADLIVYLQAVLEQEPGDDSSPSEAREQCGVGGRSPVCPHPCFAQPWLTPLRTLLGRHRSRQAQTGVWGPQ